MLTIPSLVLCLGVLAQHAFGFVPPHGLVTPLRSGFAPSTVTRPDPRCATPSLQRQRKSVASVQMQGLFGLGLGEIAVILVVVGFVLGPQTIGRLVRLGGDRASAMKDELSRVPDEFQKGLEEGESNVRARKARVIQVVREEKDEE